MYVCLCHGVTAREVRRAIRYGASTIDEVGLASGAGTCCHGCHPTIDELLETAVTVRRVRRVAAA